MEHGAQSDVWFDETGRMDTSSSSTTVTSALNMSADSSISFGAKPSPFQAEPFPNVDTEGVNPTSMDVTTANMSLPSLNVLNEFALGGTSPRNSNTCSEDFNCLRPPKSKRVKMRSVPATKDIRSQLSAVKEK